MPTKPLILSFAETLGELDGGQTVEDAKRLLSDVAKAVLETGNGGKVTITLNVARNGTEGRRRVSITDDVKATMPKVPKTDSTFFVTDEGGLTRQNPSQPSFSDSLDD